MLPHPTSLGPYIPLKQQHQEIRLVTLQPGKWDDPIQCELSTMHLHEAHSSYEALSYVWDAEPGSGEMILNGHPRDVTKNFFLALRRLRKSSDIRVLWVDALCIDQENHIEKSHQVNLMGEIYRCCARVFLWLGDDSNG
ncbi:HET-domain-containing protein, partial [Mollisia scopiformis]